MDLSLTQQDGSPVPAGITISPTQVAISGTDPVSQPLILSADSGVTVGDYDLRLQGISGNLSDQVNFVLTAEENNSVGGSYGTKWSWQSGGIFSAVGYSNGTFVAVGEGGTVLTSPDSASWEQQTSATGNGLWGTTYGNNTLVAVGNAVTALTSP